MRASSCSSSDAPAARPRLCIVTTTPLIVDFFLGPHLRALSARYALSLVYNGAEGRPAAVEGVDVELIDVPMQREIRPLADLRAALHLLVELRRRRIAGVVAVAPKAGLLGMAAGWLARVPFRCHIFQGEVWATRRGLMRALLRAADRLTARLATDLLVVSRSERDYLIAERIISASKSRVLAKGSIAGVDTQRFRADADKRRRVRARFAMPDDALVVVFVGRLKREKGVLDLAAAWNALAGTRPQLHLLFVGPDEDELEPAIVTNCPPALRERVHFQPLTGEPEAYLAAADVFCLPSHREGFGCTVIEAGATGLPALVSRIYGLQDAAVEHETALMHAPGNVAELGAQLAALVDDADLRARLGAAGLARARDSFDAQRVVDAYVAYFDDRMQARA